MQTIREELDAKQGKACIQYFKGDITYMETYEVERLIRAAERNLGTVEMVIYCVAKSEPVMFISSDLDKFKSHMEQNFFSAIKFLLPIAKRMVLQKTQGRICIIGDPVASQSAIPGMSPYACSKIALEQLALQMNAELQVHGIKVHYFLPPPMETKFLED